MRTNTKRIDLDDESSGQQFPDPIGWTSAAALVIPVIFAGSSVTSKIEYSTRRPGIERAATTQLSPFERKAGRVVSQKEAREIAKRVFARAELGLQKEREAEAEFTRHLMDDEE